MTGNVGLDTWELATILLPSQPGYSLGALAERFGLALPNAHRARGRCARHGLALRAAVRRGGPAPARRADGDRPGGLRQRLAPGRGVRLGADGGWAWAGYRATSCRWISLRPTACCLAPGARPSRWRRASTPIPVDATELAAMLKPGGAFSAAFPGYEFRPQQVDMRKAVRVNGAFNDGRHEMIEAGTGTGKSLAYLAPAALQRRCGERRTCRHLNAHDQPAGTRLLHKDIPLLSEGGWGEHGQKNRYGPPCSRAEATTFAHAALESTRRRGPNSAG